MGDHDIPFLGGNSMGADMATKLTDYLSKLPAARQEAVVARTTELVAEEASNQQEINTLISAYIHKSPRPDCAETHRFRAVLANGFDKWCSTREEAVAAIRRAARLPLLGG